MKRRLTLFATTFAAAAWLLTAGAPAYSQPSETPGDTLQAVAVDTLTAVDLAPATGIDARDVPNDRGGHIKITWQLSPDDERGLVDAYEVQRADSPDGPFATVGSVAGGSNAFDDGDAQTGRTYYYVIRALRRGSDLAVNSAVSASAVASRQWFHTKRVPLLIAAFLLGGAVLWFVTQAKKGKDLYIRKIAGLEAVDEAVGRATEMGRRIYYVPGTQDMDNVQTIAGVTILGRVARLTAEYEADLQVPVSRSMVMITAREVVKEAHLKVGRPDSYREDHIYYLTDDQFGYAAGIDGLVVREKPATIFYMGAFYAESLILVETGNSIGAIQIAGTAMPAQLPFFVAACDYTLIGEELFAASAYLSREPRLLGSLKGQDVGKAIIITALLVGVVWQTLHFGLHVDSIGDFARFFVSE
jgi:hypothetical protein